jgi:hypothetical protein
MELVPTPTDAGYLNRIESTFGVIDEYWNVWPQGAA